MWSSDLARDGCVGGPGGQGLGAACVPRSRSAHEDDGDNDRSASGAEMISAGMNSPRIKGGGRSKAVFGRPSSVPRASTRNLLSFDYLERRRIAGRGD